MKKETYCLTFLSILFLLNAFNTKSYGQNCNSQNGTYFLVNFRTILKENNRPVFGSFIVKKFEGLKISKKDLNDFTCSVYQKAQYIIPPPLDFEKFLLKCCKPTKKEIGNMIAKYHNQLNKLEKNTFSEKTHTSDGSSITIDVQKFKGELWRFPVDSLSLNNISHQIQIQDKCYQSKFYYVLKKIDTDYKISLKEKAIIRNTF